MSRSEYHVGTVKCPECGRPWTGEFRDEIPEEAVCRDCLPKTHHKIEDHKDIHINPKAR